MATVKKSVERIRLFGTCRVTTLSLKDKINQIVILGTQYAVLDVCRVRLVQGTYYGKVFKKDNFLAVQSSDCRLWTVR